MATAVESGVRGAVRKRVADGMLANVKGAFNVLIIDDAAQRILNSAFHMNELMDHNVTLVEKIDRKRQPVKSSNAVYFVAPTDKSVDQIVADWAGEPPYKGAHIYFTTTCTPSAMAKLAAGKVAKDQHIKALTDLLLDFSAPEPLLFTLEQRNDVAQYFGATSGGEISFQHTAHRFLNVFKTMCDMPAIRFPVECGVARGVAEALQPLIDGEVAASPELASRGSVALILDRSVDAVAPFLHELTYQAMMHDLHPLVNDVLKISQPGAGGRPEEKSFVIDTEDKIWSKVRHMHVSEAMATCGKLLDQLLKDNPELAQLSRGNKDISMREMGAVVKSLPQFQASKQAIAVHTELATKLSNAYKAQRLDPIVALEQKIATGEGPNGSKVAPAAQLKEVKDVCKDYGVAMPTKMRLILAYTAANGPDKIDELIEAGGFGPMERQQCQALAALNPWKGKHRNRKPSATWEFETSRFEPQVKKLGAELIGGTLSTSDYPWVRAPSEALKGGRGGAATVGGGSAAGAFGGGTGGGEGKSRFGGGARSRFGAGGGSAAAAPEAKGGKGPMLDLMHGDSVTLVNPTRYYIVVVGGATWSEARCAYELSREKKVEVLVGSTSILAPENFAAELNLVGTA